MKAAETLLRYMDRLHDFFEMITSYFDMGIEYLQQAKVWLEKILHYIDQAINSLADITDSGKDGIRHNGEEQHHMFV